MLAETQVEPGEAARTVSGPVMHRRGSQEDGVTALGVEVPAHVADHAQSPGVVSRSPRAGLEGDDHEDRVAVRVRGRYRLLEEHRAAGVVDLIVHIADQRLLGDDALRVCGITALEPHLLRPRRHVNTHVVGTGRAPSAQLQLLHGLRRGAEEALPLNRSGGEAARGTGKGALIVAEPQAFTESRGGDVTVCEPVEPALDLGGELVARGADTAVAAGVTEDRILRLFERIVRPAEVRPSFVQPARVVAGRERGAPVEAPAGGDRAERVRRGPHTHLAYSGQEQRSGRREKIDSDGAAGIAAREEQLAAPHLGAGLQLHGDPAGGIGLELKTHRGAVAIGIRRRRSLAQDSDEGPVGHRHTPAVEHPHSSRRNAVPVRHQRHDRILCGELGRQTIHVDVEAVPPLLSPGVGDSDTEAMGAGRQSDGDEVVHPVDPHLGFGQQGIAVEERQRRAGLAPHADIDPIGSQNRSVYRCKDLDPRPCDQCTTAFLGLAPLGVQCRYRDHLDRRAPVSKRPELDDE